MPSKSLLEQQVELTRAALNLPRGMSQHLSSQVMPHFDVGGRARRVVEELVDYLDEEHALDANLGYLLDGAMEEIRNAIAAGTSEEQVAIPRDRLIGCTEAFETLKTRSHDAEALQATLRPVEEFYRAVRDTVEFAEAIQMSFHMLEQDGTEGAHGRRPLRGRQVPAPAWMPRRSARAGKDHPSFAATKMPARHPSRTARRRS